MIVLSEQRRSITFGGVGEDKPVTSFLRGFSAPVRLDAEAENDELAVQMAHDSDSFNRWQASQTFGIALLHLSIAMGKPYLDDEYADAMRNILADAGKDPAFAAQVLLVPGEADMAREIGKEVDPDAIHNAREALREWLGQSLGEELLALYHAMENKGAYSPDAEAAGRRALRNTALDLYAAGARDEGVKLAQAQFKAATNMTDKIAALGVLARAPAKARDAAFAAFYETYKDNALVIDKWFALQAMQPEPDTLSRVQELIKHPAFSIKNPNRVRALIGSFANSNPTRFNALDGSGFDFIADTVIDLDKMNAQVAARLLSAFRSWRSLEPQRGALAEAALRRVAAVPGLSPDTADIAARSLA